MLKSEYLQQPCVAGFVNWLSKDCDTRTFKLNILRSRYVDTAINAEVSGMEGLLENYNWKSSWIHPINSTEVKSANWNTSQASTGQLAKGLQKAIYEMNEDLCLEWCLCILKWGGVSGAIPFLRTLHSEHQLANYLISIQPLLRLDAESDDTAIDTANIKRFDAGLTKIHAFIDTTGSPIYDSRVGAAISMLTAIYTQQVNLDHATDLLRFPAGDARGNQYRNPIDVGYRPAPKFYTSAVSRDSWARSQLRLGWILQAIIEQNTKLFDQFHTQAEKIQAFQGALFMAGYDLRGFNTLHRPTTTLPKLTPPDNSESVDTEPNQQFEQFGNVVPTGFTMTKVADLLTDFHASQANIPQPLNRRNFIDWQTQEGGVPNRNTAAAYCYPLKDSEFSIYDRQAEGIELFCNGGYRSLLALVGRVRPSWEEREHICLINVFLAGKLQLEFFAPTARTQWLIEQGFAGTRASANLILSVGRSIGKHFGLIDLDNTPTEYFVDYFHDDDWNDIVHQSGF